MSLTNYSTSSVQQSQQFEYWNDAICSVFTALHCQPVESNKNEKLGYRASLENWAFGDLQISKVFASASNVEHGSLEVAASNDDMHLVHLQISGTSRNKQGNNEALLKPGEFTICNSAMPYSLSFDYPIEMMVMRVPAYVMSNYFEIQRNFFGTTLNKNSVHGAGHLFANNLIQLWQCRKSALPIAQLNTLSQASLSMLSCHLGSMYELGTTEHEARERGALSALKYYVAQNLNDTDLTSEQVAFANKITSRTLRSKFAAEGTTFSKYLLEQRLQKSKNMLTTPEYIGYKLIDIALMCGFQSPSHFSTRFSDRFGCSPREFKYQKLQETNR